MTTPWEELAPDVDFRPAWRLDDPQIEADAVDFWRRINILPPGIEPEERAKELICVAYKEGRIVGVHTARLGQVELVRARLAMLRSAVDPAYRTGRVSFGLSMYARDILERWSIANPDEKLAGMGAVIESKELAGREKQPFWPNTRFGVVGYTAEGRQIRVSWFEHFRFD